MVTDEELGGEECSHGVTPDSMHFRLRLLNLLLAHFKLFELKSCHRLQGTKLEDLLAHDSVLEEETLFHELIADLIQIKGLACDFLGLGLCLAALRFNFDYLLSIDSLCSNNSLCGNDSLFNSGIRCRSSRLGKISLDKAQGGRYRGRLDITEAGFLA